MSQKYVKVKIVKFRYYWYSKTETNVIKINKLKMCCNLIRRTVENLEKPKTLLKTVSAIRNFLKIQKANDGIKNIIYKFSDAKRFNKSF